MKVQDVAASVAQATGADAGKTATRVRRLNAAGVIEGSKTADAKTAPYAYPDHAPAVLALMLHAVDLGLHRVEMLSGLWNFLAVAPEHAPPATPPLIAALLADVQSGGRPWVVVSNFRMPSGKLQAAFNVRFGGDFRPLVMPHNDAVLLSDLTLDAAALLAGFIASDGAPN